MYDNISTYERQLTLIKFFLYFYTFSQTHTYERTLYKTRHRLTDTRQYQTKGIYMCVIACVVGVFWQPASAKGIQKPKSKLSPYTAQKSCRVG